MTEEKEEPPSRTALDGVVDLESLAKKITLRQNGTSQDGGDKTSILTWLKTNFKNKPDPSLRETIEEYIEENSSEEEEDGSATFHEKTLISNVLKLRDMPALDAMIPRADIVALEVGTSEKELLCQLADLQYSRLPVYKDKLDEVLGTIHIKDVLSTLARGEPLVLANLIREVPIVAPSMNILDLLMEMRQTRKHMAMVVDEFGGIDGLVTIGDIIEEIVGHLEDEHDVDTQPRITRSKEEGLLADARYDVDEFEQEFGRILSDEEREDNDTLGGLAFYMAGRVPARGEVLTHSSGMVFEILDADPRRVNRIKITKIPQSEIRATK